MTPSTWRRRPKVRVAWRAGTELGECPRWNPVRRRLEFIDVPRGELLTYAPADGTRSRHRLAEELGFLVIGAAGERVVGSGLSAFQVTEPAEGGAPALADRALWTVPGDPRALRLNDAAIDRDGVIWTGTMDRHGREPRGTLYRCCADGAVEPFDDGYTIPNGFAINRAGDRLYVADSPARVVYVYELATGGSGHEVRGARREWLRVPEGDGYPDGMTVDADDHVWIAFYDGGCVRRYDRDGAVVDETTLPARRVTAVAFNTLDFRTLFATTAASDDQVRLLLRFRDGSGALLVISRRTGRSS